MLFQSCSAASTVCPFHIPHLMVKISQQPGWKVYLKVHTWNLLNRFRLFVSAQLHTWQRVRRLLRPAAPVHPGQCSLTAGQTKLLKCLRLAALHLLLGNCYTAAAAAVVMCPSVMIASWSSSTWSKPPSALTACTTRPPPSTTPRR